MNLLCTVFNIWCATSGVLTGTATVVDGDTLTVQGQAVRLTGIDAEELTEPNGPAAKHHLEVLVYNHAINSVICDWAERSHNRVVGVCRIEGESLNARMVRDGHALDCKRYSGGMYRNLEPQGARQRLIQKGYCK